MSTLCVRFEEWSCPFSSYSVSLNGFLSLGESDECGWIDGIVLSEPICSELPGGAPVTKCGASDPEQIHDLGGAHVGAFRSELIDDRQTRLSFPETHQR